MSLRLLLWVVVPLGWARERDEKAIRIRRLLPVEEELRCRLNVGLKMQGPGSDRSGSKPQLGHTLDRGRVTGTFHTFLVSPASVVGDGRDQTRPWTARLQSQRSSTDLADAPFGFQVTPGGS